METKYDVAITHIGKQPGTTVTVSIKIDLPFKEFVASIMGGGVSVESFEDNPRRFIPWHSIILLEDLRGTA